MPDRLDDETRYAQGMGVRREVLGDEHVDRANAKITPFTESSAGPSRTASRIAVHEVRPVSSAATKE